MILIYDHLNSEINYIENNKTQLYFMYVSRLVSNKYINRYSLMEHFLRIGTFNSQLRTFNDLLLIESSFEIQYKDINKYVKPYSTWSSKRGE